MRPPRKTPNIAASVMKSLACSPGRTQSFLSPSLLSRRNPTTNARRYAIPYQRSLRASLNENITGSILWT